MATQEISYLIPMLNKKARYINLIMPDFINQEIEDIGAYSYRKTRTIDYYYSEYLENKVRNIIKSQADGKSSFYLMYSKRGCTETSLYEKVLNYYLNRKYSLDCEDVDKHSIICKIIFD